jgi:glutathione S-transferase
VNPLYGDSRLLKLYFHPVASFCHKALIALYENDTPFDPVIVDLADERSATAFKAVWPMGRFPVVRDEARRCTIAESTVIVEYLDAFYPGRIRFVPADRDLAWQTRMWDRFFDNYVEVPMQKIVTDHLRPKGQHDPSGVEQAKAQLHEAYAVLDRHLQSRTWSAGDSFTLADCSAAPALFYANTVMPFAGSQENLRAYLNRLIARPSYARVLEEARPYFHLFPMEPKPQITQM